jgi:hypothetical protein
MAAAARTLPQSLTVKGANPKNLLITGAYITVNVNPIEITIDHNIFLLLQKFLLKNES